MRRNLIPVVGVIVVALILGGLIGWWASRPPEAPPLPKPPVTSVVPESNPATSGPIHEVTVMDNEEPATDEPDPQTELPPKIWSDHLDDILVDEKSDTDQKASMLADLVVGQPEEAQVEIVGHMVNLTSDDQYDKAAALLRNEKLPASVGTVLLDDLYNRDDNLSLPLFLEVAKNEKHPLHQTALENLEQRLSVEHGTNWVAWQKTIERFLKGEPEPEPEPEPESADTP